MESGFDPRLGTPSRLSVRRKCGWRSGRPPVSASSRS